jgi:hypothetical protein
VATAMAVATMAGAVVARRRQLARRRLEAAAGRGETAAAATAMAGTIRAAVRGLAAQAGGSGWRLGLAWLASCGGLAGDGEGCGWRRRLAVRSGGGEPVACAPVGDITRGPMRGRLPPPPGGQ